MAIDYSCLTGNEVTVFVVRCHDLSRFGIPLHFNIICSLYCIKSRWQMVRSRIKNFSLYHVKRQFYRELNTMTVLTHRRGRGEGRACNEFPTVQGLMAEVVVNNTAQQALGFPQHRKQFIIRLLDFSQYLPVVTQT